MRGDIARKKLYGDVSVVSVLTLFLFDMKKDMYVLFLQINFFGVKNRDRDNIKRSKASIESFSGYFPTPEEPRGHKKRAARGSFAAPSNDPDFESSLGGRSIPIRGNDALLFFVNWKIFPARMLVISYITGDERCILG